MSGELTREGRTLVDNWLLHTREVGYARNKLNSAEATRKEAEERLVDWMLPDDAGFGERIAVWDGDSLIQVEVTDRDRHGKVSVRLRGKHLHD